VTDPTIVRMSIRATSGSETTRTWIEPCRVCGALGELHPCGGEPLLFCKECAEWTIGDIADWDEWAAYWAYRERSRT
jgi:hypothetical protein